MVDPLRWVRGVVERFEDRGVYVPGEEASTVRPWRAFGWVFIGWIVALALFVLVFAVAG